MLCESERPFYLEATVAKLMAADGARHAGAYGVEIFGRYGICDEYPLSMCARRLPDPVFARLQRDEP